MPAENPYYAALAQLGVALCGLRTVARASTTGGGINVTWARCHMMISSKGAIPLEDPRISAFSCRVDEMKRLRMRVAPITGALLLALASCGSPPPRLSSVAVSTLSPFSAHEYVATTNVAPGRQVLARIYDPKGRDYGLYEADIAGGRLKLALHDLPAADYLAEFQSSSCLPLKRHIRLGIPVPTTHLEFIFGDIDQDGRVTKDDLHILKRWNGWKRGTPPRAVDYERGLLPSASDWNADGMITQLEVDTATLNLGRSK